MITYRIVKIFQFECDYCNAIWLVSDFDFKEQKYMTCIKCGSCSELDEDE